MARSAESERSARSAPSTSAACAYAARNEVEQRQALGHRRAHLQRPHGGDQLGRQHRAQGGHAHRRQPRAVRRVAGVVLQAAGDDRAAERGGQGRVAQGRHAVLRHVLQRHHPRAARRTLGEEGGEPGEVGVDEVAQPRRGQLGDRVDGRAGRVERVRQVAGVEVRVVPGVGGGQVQQRVLGPGVDLHVEHRAEPLDRVDRGAVHLRHRAQAERVLQAAARPRRRAHPQQPAHAGRHQQLAGVGAGVLHRRAVRLRRPAERDERQGGDDLARPQQRVEVGLGQHGLADRRRVARDHRQRVGAGQGDHRRAPGAATGGRRTARAPDRPARTGRRCRSRRSGARPGSRRSRARRPARPAPAGRRPTRPRRAG